MVKISVYIVTLNEEKRLDKTLKAARQIADEIIVVDSGSTDKTKDIALKNGAKFIFHKWKNIDNILKNKVIVLNRNDINVEEYINKFDKDKFIITFCTC